MHEETILQMFKEHEGLLTGHFKLSSGNHSTQYLQCAKVLQHPKSAERLGLILAEPFQSSGVNAVLSPAMGGIIIGHEVARALGCRCLFAERVEGFFTLRRGLEIQKGDRILLVEDIVTTGGSLKELFPIVKNAEAHVIGVTAIIDRSSGRANFDVPFKPPMKLEIPIYPPDNCPLCKQGIPVIKPGSRPEQK